MRFLSQAALSIILSLWIPVVFAQNTIVKNLPAEHVTAVHPPVPVKVIPHHEKIDLNKASAQELLEVKGLNTSKVRAIITYRKKNGDFKSLDDLSLVKGMKRLKPEEMKAIQDQLKL